MGAEFTAAERAWLRDAVGSGSRPVEIAAEFNFRFGRNIKRQSVRNFALRNHIEPGWDVRASPGDYERSRDRARRPMRKIWEAANGPIPEGMCVVQTVEGSFSPDTMRLMSRGDLIVANREGLVWSGPETFDAALATVRLMRRAVELRDSDPALRREHRARLARAAKDKSRRRAAGEVVPDGRRR